MKKLTISIAAFLLLAGGTLYAQSAPVQTKNQQSTTQQSNTQQQGAAGSTETIGSSRNEPNSVKAKSQATTGTPPTHVQDTAATSANPQTGGVNSNHKKAGSKSIGTSNTDKSGTGSKNQQPAAQKSGQP